MKKRRKKGPVRAKKVTYDGIQFASGLERYKYQALKNKMLSQLSSQIASKTGSSSSAEIFLKDVLRVTDPDSPFHNIPLEDFTDSFLEDYLEKNSSVIEGGLFNQSQAYSLGLTEDLEKAEDANFYVTPQTIQARYLDLLKNSYTEEQRNAIDPLYSSLFAILPIGIKLVNLSTNSSD